MYFYFIGIKGSGMINLVKFLKEKGHKISGSDVGERFFTDEILERLSIKYKEFNEENISSDIDVIIYSGAYGEHNNKEFRKAKDMGIIMYSYTQYLGMLSKEYPNAICVSGTHGKTTVTAMISIIAKNLKLNFSSFCGSSLKEFDGFSSFYGGNEVFIAETCEYKRNFLSFSPSILLINNVEEDHMDYYKDLEDIESAFIEYTNNIRTDGAVIISVDGKNEKEIYARIKKNHPDLKVIAYCEKQSDEDEVYKIENHKVSEGMQSFYVKGLGEFQVSMPGLHCALNFLAVTLAYKELLKDEFEMHLEEIKNSLKNFKGMKRRCEFRGMQDNIIYMDDYGHHPTEIKSTLKGIKEFYKGRRLVVSFQAHTFSRTAALINEFEHCFNDCDVLILHETFPSAREKKGLDSKEIEKNLKKALSKGNYKFYYEKDIDNSPKKIKDILLPGDIFLTLGAGQNYKIIDALMRERK